MSLLDTLLWEGKLFAQPHLTTSLAGKTYVVTGGLAGIGYHTSLHLALRGATVLVGARTLSKARPVLEQAEREYPKIVGLMRLFEVDFKSIEESRKGAKRVLEMVNRLDGLVNNAGRLATAGDYELSGDGIELLAQVNHIGPFVFTEELLPLLITTSKEPNSDVRIIAVGSSGGSLVPKDWTLKSAASLNDPLTKSSNINGYLTKMRRYGASKLYNTLWINELQRRLKDDNVDIIAVSLHPGLVATDKVLDDFNWFFSWLVTALSLTPSQGAWTTLFALTSPVVREKREVYEAAYLVPFGKVGKPVDKAEDVALQRKLWEITEEVVREGGLKV